ncbi:hypothetical protein Q604_UNBC18705G0002, partial [human gut metagenome]
SILTNDEDTVVISSDTPFTHAFKSTFPSNLVFTNLSAVSFLELKK